MNLIIVDTETSDLEPSQGATILELAWIILEQTEGRWLPAKQFETYIQYSGPVSPKAQAIHHIRADQLTAESGAVTRDEAISQLCNSLTDDSIIVAHNTDFDSKFLPELKNPWLCTLRTAKRLWPNAPGYSNQILRYWLGIDIHLPGRYPHQALYDVMTTVEILRKMLETHTLDQLMAMSAPILLERINFGKHKGTPFNQVPRDYLQWLRGQGNLEPDLKFTLDSILLSQ